MTRTKETPLTGLSPQVVLTPAEHCIAVVLGVRAISREQRDAAIAYLDEMVGYRGSFKLEGTGVGQPFVLKGATNTYVGDESFRKRYMKAVAPAFKYVGTLKLAVVRQERKMLGVEGTLSATDRNVSLPTLRAVPPQAAGLLHEGTSVTFSLKDPDRSDKQLVRSAMEVAAAFGVYIESPPKGVTDPDPKARLYPEFNYVKPTARG